MNRSNPCRAFRIALVAVAILCVSFALADDSVPNPEYEAWAKFKTGSSIHVRRVIMREGKVNELNQVHTLKEITPSSATIQLTEIDASGKESRGPNIGIPAKVSPQMLDMFGYGKDPNAKEGKEDLKVGDKTLHTKWIDRTVSFMGASSHVKTWRSEEVPGARVKETTEGGGGVKDSMVVISFEVKK